MRDTLPLRCVVTGRPLARDGDGLVEPVSGRKYPIREGIPIILVDGEGPANHEQSVSGFYDSVFAEQVYSKTEGGESITLIREAETHSRGSGLALEIGSGRGFLQGAVADYVALDYSFVALCKHIQPHYPRICASAERLPLMDGSVRFLFTRNALEHVPAVDQAFSEIDRVLEPGGVAWLKPAWHCVQYNCDGIPVRPYRDLRLGQKVTKAFLPLLQSRYYKAAVTLPRRLIRRALWFIRKHPTRLRFDRLRADYETFWMSDSDACSRLDSHDACLYFISRGYEVVQPKGLLSQLLAGHCAVVVRKPGQ